jgi:hypothetical protein
VIGADNKLASYACDAENPVVADKYAKYLCDLLLTGLPDDSPGLVNRDGFNGLLIRLGSDLDVTSPQVVASAFPTTSS